MVEMLSGWRVLGESRQPRVSLHMLLESLNNAIWRIGDVNLKVVCLFLEVTQILFKPGVLCL
jgi:hypothetical protein